MQLYLTHLSLFNINSFLLKIVNLLSLAFIFNFLSFFSYVSFVIFVLFQIRFFFLNIITSWLFYFYTFWEVYLIFFSSNVWPPFSEVFTKFIFQCTLQRIQYPNIQCPTFLVTMMLYIVLNDYPSTEATFIFIKRCFAKGNTLIFSSSKLSRSYIIFKVLIIFFPSWIITTVLLFWFYQSLF